MNKALTAALLLGTLALAACNNPATTGIVGPATGPAASGASSTAPNASNAATGGGVGAASDSTHSNGTNSGANGSSNQGGGRRPVTPCPGRPSPCCWQRLLAASGCAPTGPPASGVNSSAPAAVDEATHGGTVGGSNDFTPGHNPYGPGAGY